MATDKKTNRKPRAHAPENETPEQSFKRLANARVIKARKAIRTIAKLGFRKGWTMDQKNVIMTVLDDECSAVANAFVIRKGVDTKEKEDLSVL